MWKIIQIQHEKWQSKNLSSDLEHLSDPTLKEKLRDLFTALATSLSFIPMLLPGVSNCQSFSASLALLGALQAASSPSPSPLSKLGKWQVLTLCPESYQMRFSQRSGRLRQEMQFKGKKENPGNILWLCHPCYITKEHKFFGKHLGGTCSISLHLCRMHWAPGSDESSIKAKITPGDFRGGWTTVQAPGPMKGCRSPSWWPWGPVPVSREGALDSSTGIFPQPLLLNWLMGVLWWCTGRVLIASLGSLVALHGAG